MQLTCAWAHAICLIGIMIRNVAGKAVFAHYMVGTTYESHAHKDIDDAVATGLDGFALNIGDPTQGYVSQSMSYMFDYAYSVGFCLFISMDLWAAGDVGKGPDDYYPLFYAWKGHPAWCLVEDKPLISTFSDGGLTNTSWDAWKNTLAYDMYFVPDFDGTNGYYQGVEAWWQYWGGIVDGLFSWESAWPYRACKGGNYPGDITPDLPVIEGTQAHGKSYMIPMSPLQYKNSYNTNIYRAGDTNLPTRMEKILAMSPSPDFVQIISWNDGPESHYIGNLWDEQNNDTQAGIYANQDKFPHDGWRPIIKAFITAFKAGEVSIDAMVPADGQPIGAMWFKEILQDANCANAPSKQKREAASQITSTPSTSLRGRNPLPAPTTKQTITTTISLASATCGDLACSSSCSASLSSSTAANPNPTADYSAPPDGFDTGNDNLNFAMLLPADSYGTVEAWNNGNQILNEELQPGLTYYSAGNVEYGNVTVYVYDSSGTAIASARSIQAVWQNCEDYTYNMNYAVVPVTTTNQFSDGWVIFGDSYTAGPGAGDAVKDTFDQDGNSCYRGSNSYPMMLRRSRALEGVPSDFLACTGALTANILSGGERSQVDLFDPTDKDFGVLTIGGNDVGFSDILKSCVLFKLSSCDDKIDAALLKMHGDDFGSDLYNTYIQIMQKATNTNFHLLVVSYMEFFSVATDECDQMSLAFADIPGNTPYLTLALRGRLNYLVDQLNDVIQSYVQKMNEWLPDQGFPDKHLSMVWPDVVFYGHRFCEPGVTEEPGDGSGSKSWFFQTFGRDLGAPWVDPQSDSWDDETVGISNYDPNDCETTLGTDGSNLSTANILDLTLCELSIQVAANASIAEQFPNGVNNFVPVSILKTFHPLSRGHFATGDRVYGRWREGYTGGSNTDGSDPLY